VTSLVGSAPVPGDEELLSRLRDGDEKAFATLVDRYHSPMIRLALAYVPSRAVAEEVVQDTWLGVVRGIDRFEGRSSLKTWLFRILVNRARSAGPRERRHVPLGHGETVDPDRFQSDGTWSSPPAQWTDDVDARLDAAEIFGRVREAIEALPVGQREVVLLRDVEGVSSAEACSILDLSEGNQRVLLHRGRARVRQMLELELGKV
jgi:RNA polymerase sigma-70 factor, ECF subfamily